MRINHNIAALNTYRQLNGASNAQSKSMEKLSSGLRINRAGDDAAGLAISEKMRSQVRGLDQASRNSQDGISLIQTAEGALNETHDILQRMRELAVQASNDTNTTDDRKEIQKEINQLTSEVSRIGNNTEFNTQKLLDGNKSGIKVAAGSTFNSQATGTIADSGISLTAAASGTYDGAAGNMNIVISATSGASVGAAVSSNTLTITLDSDDTMDESAISAALLAGSLNSDFTVSGTGTVTDGQTGGLGGGTTTTSGKDGAASLQIGANQSQQFSVTINDMRSAALGISGEAGNNAGGVVGGTVGATFTATGSENDLTDVTISGEHGLDVSTASKASAAIKVFDQAINTVSAERSRLGAYQNRLEHTINNLGTASENLTAAESRVRDVDMAKEMMNQTKNSILSQAAQAMLAQANQQPQGVLQLLR
ncbi:flagellin [Bacillus sp. es.034]|uniref:flagellin N-terminal helical domain-containing protein n=1 Tax=Bacillus sp. es.034 TaxID=1761763 RepID=UPI000BF5C7CB|nr:flagellin [Bacillus sp. es.034]PFG04669.1 flagellin [Bacillus sp. es.034]